MAKNKIKITGQKFKEIKKPSKKIEVEPKEEKQKEKLEVNKEEGELEEGGGQERDEIEEGIGQEFDFDDFSSVERSAPSLEPTGAKQEELENMLGTVEGRSKEGKENEEKEGLKYAFEKPKYSFSGEKESEEMIDRERDISELITRLRKKDVFREAPRILTEKEEDTLSIVTPSEFRGGEFEEYITKYVEPHEKDENISIHEDRKRDIKKYKRVL